MTNSTIPLSLLPASNAPLVAVALALGLIAATSWMGAVSKAGEATTSSTSYAQRRSSVHLKLTYVVAALCLAYIPVVEGKQAMTDGMKKAVFEKVLLLDHDGKCKEKAMVDRIQSAITKCAMPVLACQCVLAFFSAPAAVGVCSSTLGMGKLFMDQMKSTIETRCKARADAKGNLVRLSGKINTGLMDLNKKKVAVGVIQDYANIKKRVFAKAVRANVNKAAFDKAVGPPRRSTAATRVGASSK